MLLLSVVALLASCGLVDIGCSASIHATTAVTTSASTMLSRMKKMTNTDGDF